MPEESEWTDTFIYDPMNPVPTAGGNNLTYLPSGQRIQTEVEKRSDVLVYTSEPLENELTVVGNIKCVLFASTDALDTDWTAKLCVVNPDGSSYNLCDGLIRARYRNTSERQEFLAPDCIHEFEIDCWATAFVFKKGTRIRIQISSSNYPRYDRNLNTG